MYKEWERKKPNKHRKLTKITLCDCHYKKGTFSKEFKSLKDPKTIIVIHYCNACAQIVKRFTKPK